MENIVLIFTFIVFLIFLGFFVDVLLMFLEYCFTLVFERPLFVHFYPFPKKITPTALHFLNTQFPFYMRLSDKKKIHFEHRIARFLEKYKFVGRKNFVITEEVKIHIAATYIMLSFGMRLYLCDVFDKIIIYPSVYLSKITKQYHKGEFNPNTKAVVFSWEDFQKGYDISNDNLNLGLHEFTHAFHIYALKSDKATFVLFNESLQNLFRVVSKPEVKQRLIESGFLRDYAYENQFEFVAVLLEYFFESPEEFKQKFPSIFLKVKHMINFNEKYFISE